MSDLVETMFSVDTTNANRNVWWANPDGSHKYGGTGTATFLPQAPGAEEVLRIMGPAFAPVEMRSTFYSTNTVPAGATIVASDAKGNFVVLDPNKKACVRTSDGRSFGHFSTEFSPVQAEKMVRFMVQLLGSGVTFDTGGTLKDGAQQWLLALLPASVKIAGEEYKPYLLARNAHDGSMRFVIQYACTRVVCANTLAMAMGERNTSWGSRHAGDVNGRIDEAREVLRLGLVSIERFQETAETLLSRTFTFSEYEKLAAQLLPEPAADATDRVRANWQGQLGALVAEWRTPDLENIKGTAWGALQAVASYSDHALALSRGSADAKGARQFANAFDDASGLKSQAFALLK